MKVIGLAIFTLQGNGAERFVLTMAKAFRDAGHQAHIIYFKTHIDLPIPKGVILHFFDYQKYRILPRCIRAQMAAKAFDRLVQTQIGAVDLVLSNLYPVDCILVHSTLPNVHLVIHNTMQHEYAGTLSARQLKSLQQLYLAKPCVAVSEGVRQDFLQLFTQDAQICTIYNPVDVGAIQQAAQAYTIPQQKYLLHVGKFKVQKRHDILLRAYALAQIDWPLLLVGIGTLLHDSQLLAQQLGIADKVVFVGFQRNPYPWIKQAQLMVLSSDFEGLGLVILEALALDTAVISTDCPSGPAEILHAKHLVSVGDVEALAEKIRQAYAAPQQFKHYLPDQFTPTHAVAAYLKLIPESTPISH